MFLLDALTIRIGCLARLLLAFHSLRQPKMMGTGS
jgi:hypothetical protein